MNALVRIAHGCRSNDERGTTVVEMAIVSVVLFMLIFGMVDLSLNEIGNSTGGNAARDGARVGIINFKCADSYPGSPAMGHDSSAIPSANYTAITTAVSKHLNGLIQGTPTVTVACYGVPLQTGAAPVVENCTSGTVTLGQDLLSVTVSYTDSSTSPLFAATSHVVTARMIIIGAPDLSATTTTTAPTTTTASTTTSSTTSTTLPATPALQTLQMFDITQNGKIDRVVATFNGAPNASCLLPAQWTLTSVPSGGSLLSVTALGSVVTLTLTEGAGAPDTSVGNFKVAFTKAGLCNAASFAAQAPLDLAPPVPVSVASVNHGATAGLLEVSDTFSVTFSEPVASGVPVAPTVTMADSALSDKLVIPGFTQPGGISSGGNYENGKIATFSSSTVSGGGTATITITVGGSCSGLGSACSKLLVGSSGPVVFAPDPGLQDSAGNGALANLSSPTFTVRLF